MPARGAGASTRAIGWSTCAPRAFAAGHLARTFSFDLDGSFATYLGWLIPWGTPLTLLGQTAEQVAEAQPGRGGHR
jgi:hypothetical protein